MRVLIIEDDPKLLEILRDGFRDQLVESVVAGTYIAGRECAVSGTHDAIVLDVLLPGGSGFDLCVELRARGITTPIIMLTARDAIEDRVRGLEAGADDYLTKPFAFRELLARVRALTRRAPAVMPDVCWCANLEVDFSRRTVRRGQIAISLTAKEFALLELLVRHEGKVLSRSAITAYVWDDNHDPFSNLLDVLVLRLRQKVDIGYEPKLIHTLRGAGYRFGVEPAS